jgi:UDP-GlcNAc3NAcA epimerase
MKQKILTVVGARPQFIKAAPVSKALSQLNICEILVHTGQHFDTLMSDVFFNELGIPKPTYNLSINSLSHGAMTGRMLEEIEKTIIAERPNLVLVYGDTNSTLAGALAAAKLGIQVAHIEAGLRSFNRAMPEEINRVLTDHVSDYLFCPTQSAVRNLANEGIQRGVHAVGDVMFDCAISAIRLSEERSNILRELGIAPRTYALATVHRAENTDDRARFLEIVNWLDNASKESEIIIPVHPRTRKLFESLPTVPLGIRLIEPVGYLDMNKLIHNAVTIYTDSGGLQKEAYFHRVPCVTLRDETEWVETVDAGWNRLWKGPDYAPRREITDYGDGSSSLLIASLISEA